MSKIKLRSQNWFNNPDNPGMTALYIERYLNFGLREKNDHWKKYFMSREVASYPSLNDKIVLKVYYK